MSDWPRSMEVRPITSWPGTLTTDRKRAQFSAGLSATLTLLDRELFHIGSTGTPVLEIAIPAEQWRLDGRPRAHAAATHPGVVLSVVGRPGPMSYPCDSFTTWQDNLRAIALSLEALRKVDRYGVTARGEQYRGFLAIEAAPSTLAGFPDARHAFAWLREMFAPGGTDVEAVVRLAQRKTHPDVGSQPDLWPSVQAAEQQLRKEGWL